MWEVGGGRTGTSFLLHSEGTPATPTPYPALSVPHKAPPRRPLAWLLPWVHVSRPFLLVSCTGLAQYAVSILVIRFPAYKICGAGTGEVLKYGAGTDEV